MGNTVGVLNAGCPCYSNSEIQAEELQNNTTEIETVSIEKPMVPEVPLKLMICITPRRQDNLMQCVPQTPSGDKFSQFPYYCPLCMEHFKDILVTSCCNHYICFPCCITYLQSKNMPVRPLTYMIFFPFIFIN